MGLSIQMPIFFRGHILSSSQNRKGMNAQFLRTVNLTLAHRIRPFNFLIRQSTEQFPEMATTVTSITGMSSLTGASATKYGGMVKVPAGKRIRNSLFHLFDYITQVAPPMFWLHELISVWRIIQMLGPALCCSYNHLWANRNLEITMSVISVIFHIVPSTARKDAAVWVMYVYAVIGLLTVLTVLVSSWYLSKTARLPDFIPKVIFFVFSTLGYLLSPIAINMIGEMIGYMVNDPDRFVNGLNIGGIVCASVIMVVYDWMFVAVYTLTILFKPDSLMAVLPFSQKLNILMILPVTLFPAIASQMTNRIASIVLTAITAIIYLIWTAIIPMNGGLVKRWQQQAMMATTESSAIFLIMEIIFDASGNKADEYILVILVAVWIIAFLLTALLFKRAESKALTFLDNIEAGNLSMDDITKPSQVLRLAVIGFRHAHPVCLSFNIFKYAIEAWPKSINTWILFAKFTAIYPEQVQQLSYIQIQMLQNRVKGSEAKHTISQIMAIMKQREANLIPDLKSRLDKVGKTIQATKAKLRYIWDLVLQGNVSELESVVGRASTAVKNSEKELIHLLHIFPNNRFVARAYARFLRDVMADFAAHKIWSQNVTLLQRGCPINQDQAHMFGIRAFPLLPNQLEVASGGQQITMQSTDDTLTSDIELDEEKADVQNELMASVRESITKLSIPAYRNARIIRIVTLILFFIAPVILVTVFAPRFVIDLCSPLDYLYNISVIRSMIFQLSAIYHHYVSENIKVSYKPDDPNHPNMVVFPMVSGQAVANECEDKEGPPSFGGTWDTKGQLRYVSGNLASRIEMLSDLRNYKKNSKDVDVVRSYVFNGGINMTMYTDPVYLDCWKPEINTKECQKHEITRQDMSLQDAALLYSKIGYTMLEMQKVPEYVMNSGDITTMVNNIARISDVITTCVNSLINYVNSADAQYQFIILIGMIAILVVVTFVYIVCGIYIYVAINKQKMLIYKCLTSLPKNVASRVAESFRMLKKDENDEDNHTNSSKRDEDLNKQEENLLKVFSTCSDATGGSANDAVIIGVMTFFVAVFHIVLTVFMCQNFMTSCTLMKMSAPHVDLLLGAYVFDLATILLIDLLPGAAYPNSNYNILNYEASDIINHIRIWQDQSAAYLHNSQFGSTDGSIVSFEALGIDIDDGTTSKYPCAGGLPKTEHDVYACWSPVTLISYVQMQVLAIAYKYAVSGGKIVEAGDSITLQTIWHISEEHLFERYFFSIFLNLTSTVFQAINSRIPTMEIAGFLLMALSIVIEIVFLVAIQMSEDRQKFALKLLLFCPSNVILNNRHISSILAGDFRETNLDTTTRDAEFYDQLVMEMPDSILTLDLNGNLTMANKSTWRIFDWQPDDISGKSIEEIGARFEGDNPFQDLVEKINLGSLKEKDKDKNMPPRVATYRRGEDIVHVEITVTILPESIIIVMTDTTQSVLYNRLIADERAKSDHLLAAILPPRLVPRVQAGEKNISFAVQSVTVVFMDIVSFTPWCGSLPAATVMKTLNLLFKEYDAIAANHPTMTKLKCIGDCYVGAGGIFAELNQPTVHAKDVVEFGLDAIDGLLRLNEEIGQKLRIRVGINTGGPIVAGVLGTAKPTFEILGPAINMAQQMEHHGVPMKVHVSRAVYELIYGSNFTVKERGQIEIKNGSVVTYLVGRAN